MSPRRRADRPDFVDLPTLRPRSRMAVAGVAVAVVALVAAVAVSAMVLVTHEQHRRAAVRDVQAIQYVRSFLTQFTTTDPFNANAYADGVLGQTTGKLAEEFKSRLNEVVISVARSEPTRGEVLDAGVERWNDDGSASVIAVTKTVTTMPDGTVIENGGRWLAMAIEEGGQWRISDLKPVV
ncbi:mammalian cell entry protein [Mycobacterium sp. ACS4331]|uniref:mammalian cell entry protein n=1 Tax=Mycobacterium sp. ACS4331 TaxID=1834121 RepID=UPI0007FF470F|nr:mammalian cell entry protein [Mycobacterium sp. ACS4331]OBF18420.1 mammalian cell entry protein [Mycobacterium sp. ACS4331]